MALLYREGFIDNDIELSTRGQSENPAWHEQRKMRLTASNFGACLRSRNPENFLRKLSERKSRPMTDRSIANCKFGLDSEIPAMMLYCQQFKDAVGHCYQPGLCVN